MPKCSRPATVFVAGVVLAIGVGWFTPSAGAADQAKADDQQRRGTAKSATWSRP